VVAATPPVLHRRCVLGDRLRSRRIPDTACSSGSMATRGHLGGLSRPTGDAALILDAAGKDIVALIETVCVGQDEVDIVSTADGSVVSLVLVTGYRSRRSRRGGINGDCRYLRVNKADPRKDPICCVLRSQQLSIAQLLPGECVRRS